MIVIKRNGSEEQLTKKKIFESICKANDCVNKENQLTQKQIKRITDSVFIAYEDFEEPIHIDSIEDMIEHKLMEAAGYEVAKCYIKYRYEKERVRNNKALTEKLTASNVANQNANIDEYSFGGRIGEAAGFVMKDYALNNLISKKSRDNHLNNEIYIHDLDHYAVGDHNCLSLPLDKLLAEGFNTRQADVRPAGSINTAFQLVAVLFQLQSLQQFGGVAATHLDWTMVPYVRKSFYKHFKDGLRFIEVVSSDDILNSFNDKTSIEDNDYKMHAGAYNYAIEKTKNELDQAVEGMYHNLNTLQSRSGNQLPFTSINYGTCTLPEGRMVVRALLNGSIKGVGKFHKTSIFPCGIFQMAEGVNRKPGDPNYDLFQLALKSTSTRLYPNYCNTDWSVDKANIANDRKIKQSVLDSLSSEDMEKLVKWGENNSSDLEKINLKVREVNSKKVVVVDTSFVNPTEINSTMGCRTYNGGDASFDASYFKSILQNIIKTGELDKTVSYSHNQKDGRGNVCPVTIILPELAMKAGRDVEKFMNLLDKKINEAKDTLLERFDWICSQPMKSAKFMYENGTMNGYIEEEGIRSALKHGTLVIGQLGLAETLQLLIGTDHTTDEGMTLAKQIEQLFKDKCAKFKKDYKLNFGVYYTPAENLCHTSMKKFQDKYGIIEKVSDKEFFTNSIHVPVWHELTPFEKIDIESKLTGYSNAGCITYIELDAGTQHNLEALETLVNYAMDKDIPYFALNVPSDTCMNCGYQDEINNVCPKCGSNKIQRLRRVTGYLTGDYKTAFNIGKQDEVENRTKHNAIVVEVD